ncbi:MAG: FliH/SctL family protein [Firmicutes bacterium]|nr:FliH/SctL family protein [Bacillota bacterium]
MPNIIKSARTLESGFYKIPFKSVDNKDSTSVDVATRVDADESNDTNAMDEAQKIVQDAKQAAQEILSHALLDAEKVRQEAILKGQEEINRKRDALLEEARTILVNAKLVREKIIKVAEPQVIELSFLIARALIRTSLFLEKDVIKDIVAEAILLLSGEESIMVKVNPDDLTVCREHKFYFQEELTDDASIKILPSEDVVKGSCIVQGQYAFVESFLENRFITLREALLKEANDDTRKPSD